MGRTKRPVPLAPHPAPAAAGAPGAPRAPDAPASDLQRLLDRLRDDAVSLRNELSSLRKDYSYSRGETALERIKRSREATQHEARLTALRAELGAEHEARLSALRAELGAELLDAQRAAAPGEFAQLRAELKNAKQVETELRCALNRARDIETAVRHGRCAAERRFHEELDRERAKLSDSQQALERARNTMRLLGFGRLLEDPADADADPADADPADAGADLADAGADPADPAGAVAPPAPADPAAYEHLDDEQLEALERDVRGALAVLESEREQRRQLFEAEEALGSAVPDFRCPLGLQLMREPVMLEDGRSYEKANIERWFYQQGLEEKPASSPVTRAVLKSKQLVVNLNLKNAIVAALENTKELLGKRRRGD